MGKAARNRARVVSGPRPAPTLHESLGTEPANRPALPAGAPSVRRAASAVGASALVRVGRLVDEDQGAEALRSVPAAQAALDVLTRQAVELARSQGSTWADVGAVFGVSKQAAQQRWGR